MLTSFPAVWRADCRVLVLGSMPGVASLDADHYYAHPRNAFWPIMQTLLGIPQDQPYDCRYEQLRTQHMALWDVMKHCEREGSLDAAIDQGTVVPNNIAALLHNSPELRCVLCNGAAAYDAFQRHVMPDLSPVAMDVITVLKMPSTSPANARMSLEQKTDAWSVMLDYVSGNP